MKFRVFIFFVFIALFGNVLSVSAQADSVIGQISSSPAESFAGGISGDGRFVVFESTANLATENPRNTDGNREIFLFDYAQRRIFQITDTRSLLTDAAMPPIFSNIRVEISNLRPVISNDGRWIAFGSNATTSTPMMPDGTNPGNFDANTFTPMMGVNPLTLDGNTEMWLYQIPATSSANLSFGGELPITNLSAGTFTRVTNTPASRLPVAGSTTSGPVIADDNREAAINDNGNYIAFTSNRDLVPAVGNVAPNNNDEIFSYVRNSNILGQITQTARGTIALPIFNQNASISGNGLRVAFLSNGVNPIVGMTGGSNPEGNVEIYYTDLNNLGIPSGNRTQVTTTPRANPGEIVNIFDLGRRMSRDGRFIAFDSFADLANESGGTNQTSFALYLYDTTLMTNRFRRIGPRSNADTAASGGDISRYPGFTDYDSSGAPQTLVLETRLNIRADGTIPATATDGLNSNPARPAQIYSYSLGVAPAMATFTRLTLFPTPNFFLASTQPIPSNSLNRMTFTLGLTEIGTGNPDFANEIFYFLLPNVVSETPASLSFATGASRLAVTASPVPTPTPTPTPSPTATPTPTPTPTPNPSPTPTPTPSPTPTPQTPPAVQGISPGMLAIVDIVSGSYPALSAQTAVGSIQRSFQLPIELSGVSMTINGAACGLKSVNQRQIVFVVPPGLASAVTGTSYPLVINNNGTVIKDMVTIVPARPDIFTNLPFPAPGGRARIFNVTNRVPFTEPFTVTTVRTRGGVRVPTVLRVFLTGVNNVTPALVSIRVGNRTIVTPQVVSNAILREPGVYSIDFTLPPELNGAGEVPIIVTINVNGTLFQSRLDDTAPFFRIL